LPHSPHSFGGIIPTSDASASPIFRQGDPLKKSREDLDNEQVARHLRMVTNPTGTPSRAGTPPSVESRATSFSGNKGLYDLITATLLGSRTSPGNNHTPGMASVPNSSRTNPSHLSARDIASPPASLRGAKAAARTTFNPAQTSRERTMPSCFSLWGFRSIASMPSGGDAGHSNPSLTSSNRI
jgi:hypothetical protein